MNSSASTSIFGGGGGYGGKGQSRWGGGFGPTEQLLGPPNFGAAGKLVLIYPVDILK